MEAHSGDANEPPAAEMVERITFGRPDLPPNRLFEGDAAAVAALLPNHSVDLIYADPPFFSGTARRAAAAGFADRWEGGIDGYLAMLRPQLTAYHRLLTATGTLYLHLDWHAVHYAKVELDRIFGPHCFMNEVIWHYGLGAASARRHFLRKHDTLLVYRRGPRPTFNLLRGPVTRAMARKYSHQDERGHYMHSRGRRYYLKGGKPLDTVWEIPAIAATARERLGYPTQKPEALLERGDVVDVAARVGDELGVVIVAGLVAAMPHHVRPPRLAAGRTELCQSAM
jgi:site-specific DNA-methyltransferase (adenine-specific)